MKKFLAYFSIASVCCMASVSAQTPSTQPVEQPKDGQPKMERPNGKFREEMKQKREKRKEERMEKFKNVSPEQREKMEKHREMMENLTPEQRQQVRKERERHFEEMKKITGKEMPPMPHERPEGGRMNDGMNNRMKGKEMRMPRNGEEVPNKANPQAPTGNPSSN